MTTIFTLPIINFPRFDPITKQPDPAGLLEASYVFGIVGESLILQSPILKIEFHSLHELN